MYFVIIYALQLYDFIPDFYDDPGDLPSDMPPDIKAYIFNATEQEVSISYTIYTKNM